MHAGHVLAFACLAGALERLACRAEQVDHVHRSGDQLGARVADPVGAVLAAVVIAGSALRQWVKKDAAKKPLAIPYAPAITAGVWLSLVPR